MNTQNRTFLSPKDFLPKLKAGDRVAITVVSKTADEENTTTLELDVKSVNRDFTFFDADNSPFMAWQAEVGGERLYFHSDSTIMEVTSVIKLS